MISQTQPTRRSERSSVFPNKYNDFVVDSKVKYGLENFVSYANLSSENFCFVTKLNKLSEPKNHLEASKSEHWKEAMNTEMKALYENDTLRSLNYLVIERPLGLNGCLRLNISLVVTLIDLKLDLLSRGSIKRKGLTLMRLSPLWSKLLLLDVLLIWLFNNLGPFFNRMLTMRSYMVTLRKLFT